MTYENILALATFALAMSITPGPNNLMLLASGANFGWLRTSPHMLGVSVGFVLLTILAGTGLVQLFEAVPVTYTILKVLCIAILLYFAYKIATASAPTSATQDKKKPLTFLQAALFQWVNPKALAMAITAISTYAPQDGGIWGVVWVAVIFGAINLPSICVWVMLGTQLRRLLDVPWKLKLFNCTAALLLVSSLYPILFTTG